MQFDGPAATNLTHRFLWGPAVDQILADEQITTPGSPGQVLWGLTDHLGSVRDVVHGQGTAARVVKHRAYDAFGNLRGDLNHDGNVDLADIDLLLWAINQGVEDELFDLNGDGGVDNLTGGDLDQLILYIVKTYYGDANLDGQFNSADMTVVFGAGEYEDGNNNNSGWAEGDWTGDGDFDSADYLLAMLYGTYENGPNPQFSNPAVEFVFGYTGRLYDRETKLQNNLHRWYDPQVGRWLSQDPIRFAAGDANLYRYVGNKATGSVDPDGLDEKKPWHNNGWTDWINPAAYIASRGASLGDRIGDGFSQGDRVELALRVARARQESLVNRFAYASSSPCDDISGNDRGRELRGILGRGLSEVGDSFAKNVDAALATAELTADVAAVVGIGSAGLGAVRSAAAPKGATSPWTNRFPGVQVRQYGDFWVKRVNPDSSPQFQRWGQLTIERQAAGLEKLRAAGRPAANSRLFKSGRFVVEDVGTPLGCRAYATPSYWRARYQDSRALGTFINDLRPGNYGAGYRAFDPALDPFQATIGIGGGIGVAYGIYELMDGG